MVAADTAVVLPPTTAVPERGTHRPLTHCNDATPQPYRGVSRAQTQAHTAESGAAHLQSGACLHQTRAVDHAGDGAPRRCGTIAHAAHALGAAAGVAPIVGSARTQVAACACRWPTVSTRAWIRVPASPVAAATPPQ